MLKYYYNTITTMQQAAKPVKYIVMRVAVVEKKRKLTGVLHVFIHVFLFILWLMVLQLSFTCFLRITMTEKSLVSYYCPEND